jgi:hypothetical protein
LSRRFLRALFSITKAMGELQKKLQDLSDDYQKLQAGTTYHVSGKLGTFADTLPRTFHRSRSSPAARVAATGEHYREEG